MGWGGCQIVAHTCEKNEYLLRRSNFGFEVNGRNYILVVHPSNLKLTDVDRHYKLQEEFDLLSRIHKKSTAEMVEMKKEIDALRVLIAENSKQISIITEVQKNKIDAETFNQFKNQIYKEINLKKELRLKDVPVFKRKNNNG